MRLPYYFDAVALSLLCLIIKDYQKTLSLQTKTTTNDNNRTHYNPQQPLQTRKL